MGLTNNSSLNEIIKFYNKCFDINSLLDRDSYILSVKYNCVDFGEWIHKNLAHYMPELADKVEAFGELRGDLFYRDIVPKHAEEYSNIVEMFEKFVFEVVELEKMCVTALRSCAESGDEAYEDLLREINVKDIAQLVKQSAVFYEAIKSYYNANDIYKWNKDFRAWIIPYFNK